MTGILVLALVLGLVAWRGWVVASDSGPFVPLAGQWCGDTPTVTVTTTAAMAPVVRAVTDDAEDICATYRITAESPEVTAQRYEGDGGQAPQVWIPDSAAARRAGREGLGRPRRGAPAGGRDPDPPRRPRRPDRPRPGDVGVDHRRGVHAAARPQRLDRRAHRASWWAWPRSTSSPPSSAPPPSPASGGC